MLSISTERYLTTEQVAVVFAVKPKTVRRWIDAGQVEAIKLHRQWRIASAEIERLLQECRRAG